MIKLVKWSSGLAILWLNEDDHGSVSCFGQLHDRRSSKERNKEYEMKGMRGSEHVNNCRIGMFTRVFGISFSGGCMR